VITPPALRSGDRIALVSPASPFTRGAFERGVAEIQRLGYEPFYDESVFERSLFTSGTATVRAEAFTRAWLDPRVSALMAVRGGYGSVKLLPNLNAARLREAPKLFIGYSDNTSLLSWLTCQCGITALHGPMIEGGLARGAEGYDESSLLTLVAGGGAGLECRPDGLSVVKAGTAEGRLFGGTLCLLAASLGTPFAFDPPAGSILFLEDVDERPYRIDRLMTQLRLSGVLARASGLVFGEMRGCDEPLGTPTARDAIEALTSDFAGPVLIGFPSGHTRGPAWTLPLGVRVRVETTPRPCLVVEESPVA
jgi:muramoyltetrapeptide carboxypeptidase